jgi:hypothetical protein
MQTNFDIDTPEGMANSITWVNNALDLLKEGGTWFVPRSSTIVTVVSHEFKLCNKVGLMSDDSLTRVLKAAGWTPLI